MTKLDHDTATRGDAATPGSVADGGGLDPGAPLPGPRGLPLIGTVYPFLRHGILGAFAGCAERYGPCNRIRLPLGHSAVTLAHPDGVEQVLRSHRHNYPKGSIYDGARLLLGNGLVTSEGQTWQRQRNLAQPAFKNTPLASYLRTMAECTEALLAEWRRRPAGEVFDIHAAMTRLTLTIVGRTLFGLDLSHQSSHAGQAFRDALKGIGSRGPGNLQIPLWLPTPGNLRFQRALRTLDRMVYDIIRRFRAGETERAEDTLLGVFMAARDPDSGAGMSDRQLRDEVITLYLAGHETTANLLTWTFYALSREPGVVARLEEEFATLPADRAPGLKDLKELAYAPTVVAEVLRLYPPAWAIARNVVADDAVCGYRVPGGSFVLLSPFVTHRLEEFWPRPLSFDPGRFSVEASRERHPFAYFPFSAGPRVCIGKYFALYEAQLVLSLIMRAFRIEVLSREVGLRAEGTLHPDRPLMVRLTARR